jgi:hypothetical protein
MKTFYRKLVPVDSQALSRDVQEVNVLLRCVPYFHGSFLARAVWRLLTDMLGLICGVPLSEMQWDFCSPTSPFRSLGITDPVVTHPAAFCVPCFVKCVFEVMRWSLPALPLFPFLGAPLDALPRSGRPRWPDSCLGSLVVSQAEWQH